MLAQIRTIFANSWVARIGAALLAVAFGAWGIQGALFGQGGANGGADIATVQGRHVTLDAFGNAYQRQLQQSAQAMAQQTGQPADPSSLPAEAKSEIAQSVLQNLVTQAALVARAEQLGLSVPDASLRQTIFSIPQFKGPDGQFDRRTFNQVLAANNLTEARVLDLVRDEMLTRALIEPVRSGAVAPPAMVRTLFDFGAETRTVQMVSVPDASMPAPAAPDDATLRRFYDNHPQLFTVPETRHIRAVVLSPETVGRDITIPESAIRAAYDAERATVFKPERRSAEIVTVPDAGKAAALASFWRGGASWPQVEAQAAADGAFATALPDAQESEFPTAGLGHDVFAAKPGEVAGPITDAAGSVVLLVTKVTPAVGDYASEHDALRDRLAAARATSGMQDRVDRLADAIAGGGLDKIPTGLGAEAVEGTLDAAGNTPDGGPAPIPGSDALRQAIIAAAFAARQGAPPNLTPGPGHGDYALSVEEVTPAHERPFDAARDQVLRLWTADARQREANAAATAIYTAAKAAHALSPAIASGRAVDSPPAFHRGGAPSGVPPQLAAVVFGLAQGDATMVGTADGFTVGVLTAIGHPQPADDQAAYDRLKGEIVRAISDDLEISYAQSVAAAAKPQINAAAMGRAINP